MKNVQVYLKRGTLYFCPYSQTSDGVWVSQDLSGSLGAASTHVDKGAALRLALTLSTSPIPPPPTWSGLNKNLFAAAGVKSWTQFTKSSKAVSVELSEREICFVPQRYMEASRGFEEIISGTVKLSNSGSDEEFGRALDDALSAAE
jgi:hypothetical protein